MWFILLVIAIILAGGFVFGQSSKGWMHSYLPMGIGSFFLLKIARRILLSRWAIAAGLIAALWQGWTVIRPTPWPTDQFQQAAIDELCWQAAESVPDGLPGIKSLAVLRLAGYDHDGRITSRLAECLHRLGRYEVQHQTWSGNVRKELGIAEAFVSSLEDAVAQGRGLGVGGVIFGSVRENRRDRDSASVRLDFQIAQVATGQEVLARTIQTRYPDLAASQPAARSLATVLAVLKPVAVWVIVVLLLPILLVPAIRELLKKDSNAVNFGMLAVLTLVDLLVACLLIEGTIAGWVPIVFLLGALVLSGLYNYWLCSLVERTSH